MVSNVEISMSQSQKGCHDIAVGKSVKDFRNSSAIESPDSQGTFHLFGFQLGGINFELVLLKPFIVFERARCRVCDTIARNTFKVALLVRVMEEVGTLP